MDCSDKNIIVLIEKRVERSEIAAIQCLKKCIPSLAGLLIKTIPTLKSLGLIQTAINMAITQFFLNVRSKRFTLSGQAQICTYLARIAINIGMELFREEGKPPPPSPPDPGPQVDDNDFLYEAIEELSDPDRDIIVSVYFDRLDLMQYAKLRNISYDAARKRLERARERLKIILKNRAS